ILIIVQCCIIIGLFFLIYKKKLKEKPIINVLSTKTVNQSNQSAYTHFYELPASTTLTEIIVNSPYNTSNYVNSDTLHEEKEYSVKKDKDTYRIITLGDSFTFGLFVKTHENWTELLEKQLSEDVTCKKIEVINLGVSGYDIQYSIERFRIRGQKYNPDLVIFFLRGEDIWQINEMMWELVETNVKSLKEHFKVDKNAHAWNQVIKMHQDKISESEMLRLQSNNISKINEYYSGQLILMTLPSKLELLMQVLTKYVEA